MTNAPPSGVRRRAKPPELLDVVGAIYEAGMEPESWQRALARSNAYLNVKSSMVNLADAKSGVAVVVNCGSDPAAVVDFMAHYWPMSPTVPIIARSSPGALIFRNRIAPDREFVKTEFYGDWLQKYGGFYYANVVLARSADRSGYLVFHRQKRTGAFEDADETRFQQLIPHLRRAFQISRTLSGLAAERDTALAALNRMPYGVILLDEQGSPVGVNMAAEAVLARADGIALSSRGIQVAGVANQIRLERLIHEAAETGQGRGTHSGGALAVPSPDRAEPYRVLVVPVRMPVAALDVGAPRACVACIVQMPDDSGTMDPTHLCTWFGLTPAEARVAIELADAHNPDEIGDTLGISWQTARTHRRAVYDKMGVHSQAELVKVLLRSPAGLRKGDAEPVE